MKNKYLFRIIIALLTLTIIAPTCLGSEEEEEVEGEDDRPYYEEMFVGEWHFYETSITANDGVLYTYSADQLNESTELITSQDKTFTYSSMRSDTSEIVTGTYNITEDLLYIYPENQDNMVFNYFLNDTSLILMYTDTLYLPDGQNKFGDISEKFLRDQ